MSMEVAAGECGGCEMNAWGPERFGDEVHDVLLNLEFACDAEEQGGLREE